MAARRGRRGRAVREIGWRGGAGAWAGTITRREGGGEFVGVGATEDGEGKEAASLPGGFDFVPCAVFSWCIVGPILIFVGQH